MPFDPLSAFLLGTCFCMFFPCLLPFCLSLPVIPLPMIIIRYSDDPAEKDASKRKEALKFEVIKKTPPATEDVCDVVTVNSHSCPCRKCKNCECKEAEDQPKRTKCPTLPQVQETIRKGYKKWSDEWLNRCISLDEKLNEIDFKGKRFRFITKKSGYSLQNLSSVK